MCSLQDSATLQFCANKLDKKDFFGKSDPFMVFYRSNEDGTWVLVVWSCFVFKLLAASLTLHSYLKVPRETQMQSGSAATLEKKDTLLKLPIARFCITMESKVEKCKIISCLKIPGNLAWDIHFLKEQ